MEEKIISRISACDKKALQEEAKKLKITLSELIRRKLKNN